MLGKQRPKHDSWGRAWAWERLQPSCTEDWEESDTGLGSWEEGKEREGGRGGGESVRRWIKQSGIHPETPWTSKPILYAWYHFRHSWANVNCVAKVKCVNIYMDFFVHQKHSLPVLQKIKLRGEKIPILKVYILYGSNTTFLKWQNYRNGE